MALQAKASEYFASINSMASRLCIDLHEATLTNKHLLDALPFDDQQQLLHDAIVTQAAQHALMKYPQRQERQEPDADEQEKSPAKYALKMIVDDHYSYRDEHSGPFSFHTASQRDLASYTQVKKRGKKVTPQYNKLTATPASAIAAPCIKAVQPVLVQTVLTQVVDDNEEILTSEQIHVDLDRNNLEMNDLDMVYIEQDEVDGSASGSEVGLIPKTGLDLLDNW